MTSDGYLNYCAIRDTRLKAQTEAHERRERERLDRTPNEQLRRLNKDHEPATRERARLNKLIAQGLGDRTFRDIADYRSKREAKARIQAEKEAARRAREAEKADAHYEALSE